MDRATTREEEEKIRHHLAHCSKCEEYLADLRKSVSLVRELEDLDPPGWMKEKVMEQLREEKKERKSIIERIFFPSFTPVPLGTAAALLIVISVLILFQATKKELRFSPPPSRERALEMKEGGKPSAHSLKYNQKNSFKEKAELKKKKAAPSRVITTLKKSPGPREGVTSAITLSVKNPAESGTKIEMNTLKLGGSIISRRSREKNFTLIVRIDSGKIDEFMEMVEEEGRLHKPVTRKGSRLREGKSTLKITLLPIKSR